MIREQSLLEWEGDHEEDVYCFWPGIFSRIRDGMW